MTQPTSDDIEKMIDAAARGSMEKRAKVIEDADLREQIFAEFKQVHKLAPADYTENCTNVVMAIIHERDKARDAAIRLEELVNIPQNNSKVYIKGRIAKLRESDQERPYRSPRAGETYGYF